MLKDSQIAKLVGITTNSVTSIRNKSYWNYNSLNSKDPVAIGLFSQKDLVEAIEKAEAILNKVGIYERKDYHPAHLSGGQQRMEIRGVAFSDRDGCGMNDQPERALAHQQSAKGDDEGRDPLPHDQAAHQRPDQDGEDQSSRER